MDHTFLEASMELQWFSRGNTFWGPILWWRHFRANRMRQIGSTTLHSFLSLDLYFILNRIVVTCDAHGAIGPLTLGSNGLWGHRPTPHFEAQGHRKGILSSRGSSVFLANDFACKLKLSTEHNIVWLTSRQFLGHNISPLKYANRLHLQIDCLLYSYNLPWIDIILQKLITLFIHPYKDHVERESCILLLW
jgi:hypothetical protein